METKVIFSAITGPRLVVERGGGGGPFLRMERLFSAGRRGCIKLCFVRNGKYGEIISGNENGR
jgi:hypothetical protein